MTTKHRMKIRTEAICTYFSGVFCLSCVIPTVKVLFSVHRRWGPFCFYTPWQLNDRLKVIRLCDDRSEATLRWDSGAGTISGETARNLQKIIDKRTNVPYNSKLVNNVFTLQLKHILLLIGFMPTHISCRKKYSPILG